MVSRPTVRVGLNGRGWEITLPGERNGVTFETLDEAQWVATCAPLSGTRASWSCATPTTRCCIASSSTAENLSEPGSLADVQSRSVGCLALRRSASHLQPLSPGVCVGSSPHSGHGEERLQLATPVTAPWPGVRSASLSFFSVRTHKRLRSEYSRIRAGPAARTLTPSLDATNGATCATRHGVWVTGFDCGAGSCDLGVIPPTRWTRLNVIDRAALLAILLARASLRFPPRSSTCRLSSQPLMSRRASPAAW